MCFAKDTRELRTRSCRPLEHAGWVSLRTCVGFAEIHGKASEPQSLRLRGRMETTSMNATHRHHFLQTLMLCSFTRLLFFSISPCGPQHLRGCKLHGLFWGLSWRMRKMIDLLQLVDFADGSAFPT